MERATIQDWTFSKVPMQAGGYREVQYRVYRDGSKHYQEICETDGAPVHTLELPEGMKLEDAPAEVIHRMALDFDPEDGDTGRTGRFRLRKR